MLVSDIDPAHGRLLVPPGLVQGYTARWRRPRAVSPSPNSRGLTDRLNDTVGVTACLRLIFRMWLKFAVGSFSSVLSRQKGPFQCCLCTCVCSLCVCTCTPALLKRCTREKSLYGYYPNLMFPEMMSFVWACLQCVLRLFIACHTVYIHTAVLAGRHVTEETAEMCFCLWVSVSLNQVAFV